MKKSNFIKAFVLISVTLIFIFLTYSYINNQQTNDKLLENKVSKEDAHLSVVTFGDRIESDRIYFLQWEAMSPSERKDSLESEQVFIFSPDEFKKDKNSKLIHSLLANKKTVLLQGYKMDVRGILSGTDIDIPYFEINSNKHLYFYLYGSSYSDEQAKMIPVLLLGNFDSAATDVNVANFLIKNYSTQ